MDGIFDINGLEIIKEFHTPEMYGAKGNGIDDDTSAIQSALNNRGLILFSPGKTYKTTKVLRVYASTVIDLNGSTIICTWKHMFFNFLGNSAFTGYNGNGNITIRNGILIGGATSFAHAENVLLENVSFKDLMNDHFLEICACKNYRIYHCSFVGMRNLNTSVMEYINIDPCARSPFPWLDDASSAFYDGTANDGISIEGCKFSLGTGDYAYGFNAIGVHASDGSAHKNVSITRNEISGYTGCGIRLNNMQGVLVDGNAISTVGDGIRIGDVKACSDLIIKNNYVYSSNGTRLVKTSGRYTNLTVANNVTQGDAQDF